MNNVSTVNSNLLLIFLNMLYARNNIKYKFKKCLVMLLKQKGCRITTYMNTLLNYNEIEFRSHFRLSRSSVDVSNI